MIDALRGQRLGAVGAALLAVAFLLWLFLRDDDEAGPESGERTAPVAASVAELRRLALSVGHPVYWAGDQPGFTYELTRTSGGIYIRYLPRGTELGARHPAYLTVATYPQDNGFERVRAASERPDTRTRRIARGGILHYSLIRPESVFLAYPGGDYQVEVYDPTPRRARNLILSGQVRPIRGR